MGEQHVQGPSTASWFARAPREKDLRCANCAGSIASCFPSLHHHPRRCPHCGIECVFLSLPDEDLQIVVTRCPPGLLRAVRWAQRELEELIRG